MHRSGAAAVTLSSCRAATSHSCLSETPFPSFPAGAALSCALQAGLRQQWLAWHLAAQPLGLEPSPCVDAGSDQEEWLTTAVIWPHPGCGAFFCVVCCCCTGALCIITASFHVQYSVCFVWFGQEMSLSQFGIFSGVCARFGAATHRCRYTPRCQLFVTPACCCVAFRPSHLSCCISASQSCVSLQPAYNTLGATSACASSLSTGRAVRALSHSRHHTVPLLSTQFQQHNDTSAGTAQQAIQAVHSWRPNQPLHAIPIIQLLLASLLGSLYLPKCMHTALPPPDCP